MKNNNKLKQLQERFRELVPRLMDKTMGCSIYVPANDDMYVLGRSCHIGKSKSREPYPTLRITGISSQSGTTVLLPLDRCKIIGHPITKADIEDALFKSGLYHEEEISQNILPKLCFVWDYDIKTLSEQTPEVIDALHSIFFKTK